MSRVSKIETIQVEEAPVSDDGLFVTTRSGKGGTGPGHEEIKDVSPTLKRKAASAFEDMLREQEKEEEILRKKQRLQNVFLFYGYMSDRGSLT